MSPLLQQIEAFTSGTASEFAFPADLSVEERKLVKIEAEKLGLSSQSFGMGSERRIHIFKPTSSKTMAPEPVKYSVKNTFIEPLDAWTPAMTRHWWHLLTSPCPWVLCKITLQKKRSLMQLF